MNSVQGGVYELDIRPMRGFNIVTFKMDVAFADLHRAEQLYEDLRRLFDADVSATLTYTLPTPTEAQRPGAAEGRE